MTPDQALSILVQIANNHLCTKQDRLVIDQAITVLNQLVSQSAK